MIPNLSQGSLLSSLLVSSIGLGLFLYGKKETRLPQLGAGLALMVYPVFVASTGWMLAIAGGVLGALWVALRMGL
jgi:hypothetical protein